MRLHLDCSHHRSFDVSAVDLRSEGAVVVAEELRSRTALLITTPTVNRVHGLELCARLESCGARVHREVLRIREASKTLEAAERVVHLARRYALDRKSVLIALGGGVCSDVVGVAASMIRRGIRHVRIPTTLLAQIDAAIGLKAGLNFGKEKNYLGCFYPPAAVFVDRRLLATLRRRQIRQGLAEIVKVALIKDSTLYDLLSRTGMTLIESRFQQPAPVADQVIHDSIARMLAELQENPYEDRGFERLVDFGHTFSPRIESASRFRISHGEAVSIDMALACMLAAELQIMSRDEAEHAVGFLSWLGLPTWTPLLTSEFCGVCLAQAVAHRGGALNLVVPQHIGQGVFVRSAADVGGSVLERALARLAALNERFPKGDAGGAARGAAPELSLNSAGGD
jgi:2-epi-5-epi-valiolone synthase